MFKQTKIAAAALALSSMLVGQEVSAVALDENGNSAQVLIFPYYNVNNNFQTSFHIRNSKNEYKAVKLRFRESKYSNDILDYGIYMSPYDEYTLSVVKDGQGKARVISTDNTCSHPAIPKEGVELRGSFYSHSNDATAFEGYLEVFEMGVVEDGTPIGANNTMYNGLKHIAGNNNTYFPKDCSVVSTAWTSGYFTQGGALADTANYDTAGKSVAGYYSDEPANNPTPGIPDHMFAPTGGLRGFAILLDVAKGAAYAFDATALRNYQNGHAQHYLSYDAEYQFLPSLASGNDTTSVVARDDGRGSIVTNWALVNADWGLSDPNIAPDGFIPTGINPFPVADVLAATSIQNDFFTDPTFNGATDWIVTFPMRKHGIFNNYRYGGFTYKVPATSTSPETPAVPRFTANDPASSKDVKYTFDLWNREEASVINKVDALENEVNIISFVNTNNINSSNVVGSAFAKQYILDNKHTAGWGNLVFDGRYTLANLGNSGWLKQATTSNSIGVPVLGFALMRGATSANSPNAMGETLPHTFIRARGN